MEIFTKVHFNESLGYWRTLEDFQSLVPLRFGSNQKQDHHGLRNRSESDQSEIKAHMKNLTI